MILAWPLPEEFQRITSRFGLRRRPVEGASRDHNGIDISAPVGTPVFAPAAGRISLDNETLKGGKQLRIQFDHDPSLEAGFAHLDSKVAHLGTHVSRGQIIAYTGNTGISSGPHLHLTIRRAGEAVDPVPFFRRILGPSGGALLLLIGIWAAYRLAREN